MERILICWNGWRELHEAMEQFPVLKKSIDYYVSGNDLKKDHEGESRIRKMLKEHGKDFSRIFILMDFKNKKIRDCLQEQGFFDEYQKTFLEYNVIIEKILLSNPHDYSEVYPCIYKILSSIAENNKSVGEYHFLQSSGTQTMRTSSLLVAKTLFKGNKETFFWLYDKKEQRVSKQNIQFNLYSTLLPNLIDEQGKAVNDVEIKDLVGHSKVMMSLKRKIDKIARSPFPVILLGESGCGKGQVARAINESASNPRDKKKFREVNCALYEGSLATSFLFGHTDDAFTTTSKLKQTDGIFKSADGGILFLDEIGELPPDVQAKLLKIVEPPKDTGKGKDLVTTCRYYRFGDDEANAGTQVESNVRLIVGTNQKIDEESQGRIGESKFRRDLYQRLCVHKLLIPPLRDHKEDIPDLVDYFLNKYNKACNTHKQMNPDAMKALMDYEWPPNGNIRELENFIKRGIMVSDSDFITPEDLEIPNESAQAGENTFDKLMGCIEQTGKVNLQESLLALEEKCIQKMLNDHTKTETARILGYKSYQAVDSRLKTFEKNRKGSNFDVDDEQIQTNNNSLQKGEK